MVVAWLEIVTVLVASGEVGGCSVGLLVVAVLAMGWAVGLVKAVGVLVMGLAVVVMMVAVIMLVTAVAFMIIIMIS